MDDYWNNQKKKRPQEIWIHKTHTANMRKSNQILKL